MSPVEAVETSPLSDALSCVGDRWTLVIVDALLDGPKRFGDIEREIDAISPNVLSARLRKLADQRLVVAEPYSIRPERFTYELTERGRELAGPIRLLAGWATRRTQDAGPAHAACGSQLEAVLFCPTCREPVSADDVGDLDYA